MEGRKERGREERMEAGKKEICEGGEGRVRDGGREAGRHGRRKKGMCEGEREGGREVMEVVSGDILRVCRDTSMSVPTKQYLGSINLLADNFVQTKRTIYKYFIINNNYAIPVLINFFFNNVSCCLKNIYRLLICQINQYFIV